MTITKELILAAIRVAGTTAEEESTTSTGAALARELVAEAEGWFPEEATAIDLKTLRTQMERLLRLRLAGALAIPDACFVLAVFISTLSLEVSEKQQEMLEANVGSLLGSTKAIYEFLQSLAGKKPTLSS